MRGCADHDAGEVPFGAGVEHPLGHGGATPGKARFRSPICESKRALGEAASAGVPTYQWLKDGLALTDTGPFSGTQSATLLISNASADELGVYRCRVGNACGSTLSNPALLEMCVADWSCDAAVNSSDISAYLSSWLASVANGDLMGDFDDDGAVNSTDISVFLTAWLDAVQNGC